MAKLECGCTITDHRPGGEFLLYAGSTLLDTSELEWEDAAEGIWLRSGLFSPTNSYLQLRDLFQAHTREVAAARLATVPYNRVALQELRSKVAGLGLRLCVADGRQI